MDKKKLILKKLNKLLIKVLEKTKKKKKLKLMNQICHLKIKLQKINSIDWLDSNHKTLPLDLNIQDLKNQLMCLIMKILKTLNIKILKTNSLDQEDLKKLTQFQELLELKKNKLKENLPLKCLLNLHLHLLSTMLKPYIYQTISNMKTNQMQKLKIQNLNFSNLIDSNKNLLKTHQLPIIKN